MTATTHHNQGDTTTTVSPPRGTHVEPPTPYNDDPPPYDPAYDTPPTRHTPQDQEAEQAVLGALLLNPNNAPQLAHELQPTDFYNPTHETIWNTAQHLHQTSTLDPLTLINELRKQGQLTRIGGAPYIHTLLQACPTPHNATHYAEIVRDTARRRAIQQTATRLHHYATTPTLDTNQALSHALDEIDQATSRFGPTNPNENTSWAPINLDPVLAGDYLDPPPTILTRTDGQPLIYDHAVHTISGESESGKTWLTLHAAHQQLTTNNHVCFIDFEDRADRVIGRLLALGTTPTQLRTHFTYIRPNQPLDPPARQQLSPHLPKQRLVIIDGVTEAMTLHGYDANNNKDTAHFQTLLPRWIADHGPAVILIDHVVKDKDKQDRFAIGAQHKLAGIDGAAYIVKTIDPFGRGKHGISRVIVAKDRPGHVREHTHGKSNTIAEFNLDATTSDLILTATLNPPGHTSGRADDGSFEPTILMERISRYVQANPGMSKKAIEEAQNGRTTTKRLALELLVSHGHIHTKTGPRGAVQHFHHTPYYATPPTPNP